MSKRCINCNSSKIYDDNVSRCPICGNYLKTINSDEKYDNKDFYETDKSTEIEGTVINFSQQEVKTFFITKLFRSLFKGLPYCYGNTINTFQIEHDGKNNIDEMILYGKIVRGRISKGNRIKAIGIREKSGSFIAKKIFNETSNISIKTNLSVNPIIVWFLSIAFIAIIYKITHINYSQMFSDFIDTLKIKLVVFGTIFFIIITMFLTIFKRK